MILIIILISILVVLLAANIVFYEVNIDLKNEISRLIELYKEIIK